MLSTLCPPNTGKDEKESQQNKTSFPFPSPPQKKKKNDNNIFVTTATNPKRRLDEGTVGRFRVTSVRVLGCSRLSVPGKSTTALTIKVNGREKQNQAAGAFLPSSRHEWRRVGGRRRREGARGRHEPCLDVMDGRRAPGPILFVFKTKLRGVFCKTPWGRGGMGEGASGGPTTLLPSILLPGCSPSRQGWKTTPGCFLFTFSWVRICAQIPPPPRAHADPRGAAQLRAQHPIPKHVHAQRCQGAGWRGERARFRPT